MPAVKGEEEGKVNFGISHVGKINVEAGTCNIVQYFFYILLFFCPLTHRNDYQDTYSSPRVSHCCSFMSCVA